MRRVDEAWTPVFFFFYILFVFMILVNIFLAILNTSYSTVREDLTNEQKRLKKLENLRPSTPKQRGNMLRWLAVNAARIFYWRNALLTGGIYKDRAKVERDLKRKMERESKSANPW